MHDAAPSPEIVRAHCNRCGGNCNSFLRAAHTKHDSDEHSMVDWWDTYQVLECCGCGEVIVRHEYRLSEDTNDKQDPATGEWRQVMTVKTVYFPPALARRLPKWFGGLEEKDELLAGLLREVYAALQNDLLVVATAGARILLDRVMVLLLGEDAGGFADKLRGMADRGIIGTEDRELLGAMIDAGHAASHRGLSAATGALGDDSGYDREPSPPQVHVAVGRGRDQGRNAADGIAKSTNKQTSGCYNRPLHSSTWTTNA